MLGYTSFGVGVSGIPVRFGTRGEVLRLTLRVP
jgi:predicted MPP superfamily phosphohydrolase